MTSPALQTGSALSNCRIKHKSFIPSYKNTPRAGTENRTVLKKKKNQKRRGNFPSPSIYLNPHLLTSLRVRTQSHRLVWLTQPSPYLGVSVACLGLCLSGKQDAPRTVLLHQSQWLETTLLNLVGPQKRPTTSMLLVEIHQQLI